MTLIYGIDPGLSGAVAIIDDRGKILRLESTPVITVKKEKGTKRVYLPQQMLELLKNPINPLATFGGRAALELVNAMPGQGVTSMFSMGRGVGMWEMALAAEAIPMEWVTPQTWKKEFGLRGSDKNASIVKALQLFPSAAQYITRKCDEGRAEALLICEWLRRKHENADINAGRFPRFLAGL
jgi:crossover junction endodeoxyribonuclease RuvC